MAAAFEAPDFKSTAFGYCEKAVGHRNLSVLFRGQKNNITIDSFDGQRQVGLCLDLPSELFVIFARSFRLPDIQRIN